MDSPLARVILATLAGYLMILLGLSVYDWIAAEYPRRPTAPMTSKRIHHPFNHLTAVSALERFDHLPEPEKTALKEGLESRLIPVGRWTALFDTSNVEIVCMGELHKEATRRFLAEAFFANVPVDVLLLEATPGEMKGLIRRMEAGREYFPLLDADIMNILRAGKTKNPDIRIEGIEETDAQAVKPQSSPNARDQSIAENFWSAFHPGRRHIILFGALHCTNETNWLFHNLRSQASPKRKDAMLNIRVLGEHQNGPLEAFVYFLDEIAVDRRNFVISDTCLLPPLIYDWFPLLNQQTLKKYRSLMVFRP
jgi:hypothetical protein